MGSTRLATTLDLEDFNQIVSTFFHKSAGIIGNEGGHISKYLGDGFIACFGFPEAREQAATEAVAASLEIKRLLGDDETLARHGIEIRIGIATGNVVIGEAIGSGHAAEISIVGAVPSLAARLQSAAKPSMILVSSSTRDAVADSVELRDVGALSLKGFEQDENVFEAVGLKSSPARLSVRFAAASDFFGRAAELDAAKQALSSALDRRGCALLVSGTAGIGKSRFLNELRQLADAHDVRWLEARATSLQARVPYALARQLASVEQALESGQRLLAGDDAQNDSFQERHDRMLLDTFHEQEAGKPLVLVFEDLHWADDASLGFVRLLAQAVRAQPWLILASSRTTDLVGEDDWTKMELGPLNSGECSSLIRGIVGEAYSERQVSEIVGRSGGVPLFASELSSWYIDTGPGAPSTELPGSVADVVLAKLESCEDTLPVLQAMSILGHDCSPLNVGTLMHVPPETIRGFMFTLSAAGILREDSHASGGFEFSHSVYSDIVHQTILSDHRRALHRRAAGLIEAGELGRPGASLLARHWRLCGEHNKAVDILIEAAKFQQGEGAFLDSRALLMDAQYTFSEIDRTARQADQELRLQTAHAGNLQVTLGYSAPETVAANKRAARLAEKLGAYRESFNQAVGRWMAASSAGQFPEAEQLSQRALSLAFSLGRPQYLAIGWMTRVTALGRTGRLREYRDAFAEGEKYFMDERFRSTPGAIAQTYGNAALFDLVRGEIGLSRNRAAIALKSGLASATEYDQAYSRYIVALYAIVFGADGLAKRLAESALEISRRGKFPQFEATSEIVFGRAIAGLGDPEAGVQHILSGLERMEDTASNVGKTIYFTWLGEAERFRGQPARARESLDRALAFNEHEKYFRPETQRLLALQILEAGGRDRARHLLDTAYASAAGMGAEWLCGRIRHSMGLLEARA